MAADITQYISSFQPPCGFSKPKYPLFCGQSDPMFCALTAVGLGCDVLPGGVKGVGPATLYGIMKALSETSMLASERCNQLATELSKLGKNESATSD